MNIVCKVYAYRHVGCNVLNPRCTRCNVLYCMPDYMLEMRVRMYETKMCENDKQKNDKSIYITDGKNHNKK